MSQEMYRKSQYFARLLEECIEDDSTLPEGQYASQKMLLQKNVFLRPTLPTSEVLEFLGNVPCSRGLVS